MAFFKLLHILAVVVWVGGMFFAYLVLRLSAAEILDPPERLRLWDAVFSRFFKWVWLAVFLLLISGFYMVYLLGGFDLTPWYVHRMLMLGILMLLIFLYVFFVCHVRLNFQVTAQDWPKAGDTLATIRLLFGLNLLVGLATITVAVVGGG